MDRRLTLSVLVAFGVVAAVGGCTAPVSSPPASPTSSMSPEPSVSPSESPESPESPPTLQPTGTASDNLAYFTDVNTRFLAGSSMPGGRAIVDNLVAAGFDKTLMQVTPDKTAIGRDADSVQFSVRFGDQCLVGQASAAGYAATVGPAVAGTTCLLGVTRAIDW